MELKGAITAAATLRGPLENGLRLHHECSARAEAARARDSYGERRRAGACHRRQEDWYAQPESFAESPGAKKDWMRIGHANHRQRLKIRRTRGALAAVPNI